MPEKHTEHSVNARFNEMARDGRIIFEHGRIRYINHRIARLIGKKQETAFGQNFCDHLSEESRERFDFYFAELQLEKISPPIILTLLTAEGGETVIECEGCLASIRSSNALLPILGVSDVTEREELRKELERAKENLRQTSKMEAMGRIACGIVHDLSNMLAALNPNLELMQLDFDRLDNIEPGTRKRLRDATDAAAKARSYLKQILDLCRERSESVRTPFDFGFLANEILGLLNKSMSNADLSVMIEESLTIICDPGQIQQVVMNLLINAHDAVEAAEKTTGRKGKIEVRADRFISDGNTAGLPPGQYCRFRVKDNGTGIPPKDAENIFKYFFTTKKKGSGVGLASSSQIANLHGGFIFAANNPEGGAEFSLYLPMVENTASENRNLVLIADDEASIVRVTKKQLENSGYSPIIAHSGKEALEIVGSSVGQIAVVLIDQGMSDIGGLKLAKAIEELDSGIWVVIFSGTFAEPYNAQTHPNVLGSLIKPVKTNELATMIGRVIPPKK